VVRHFKRRMHIHIIKLAMIFAASTKDLDSKTGFLMIDKIDLTNAIICVNDVMRNLDRAFRGVGESDLAEATAKVQDFIDRKGAVTYREILTNLHRHVSPENLARIMEVMYSIGYCERKSVGKQEMIMRTKKVIEPAKTSVTSLH